MSAERQPVAGAMTAAGALVTEADVAVVRTVTYAALFQAPLTLERLHRLLMDVRVEPPTLARTLRGPWVRERVEVRGGLVYPRGRADWLLLRRRRRQQTRRLLRRHGRALRALARFPFVRLVALSGACAHDNAGDGDVDVFLVTRAGRAWCVYLGLVLLSRMLGVRRTLCINYVVDEDAVTLPERDLFTACELAGMRPLAGREAYCALVRANAWVAESFPNFFERHAEDACRMPAAGAARWLERLLDLGPAPVMERLSRRIMGARLRRKAAGARGVFLADGRLKLHLHDHRERLMAAWREAQLLAGLEPRARGSA